MSDLSTPPKRFKIALSFPGEKRERVEPVAEILCKKLGTKKVFYDDHFKSELARPDLDVYLQKLYHDEAELIVVFLCAEYEKKLWCRLEWRAIRNVMAARDPADIMPLRFDDTQIPGLFSTDGYLDISHFTPSQVAASIIARYKGKPTRPENMENPKDLAAYKAKLEQLCGTLRILGKSEPVPLAGIFTDVFLLDQPTAWRRYDIARLCRDSEKLEQDVARRDGVALVQDKDPKYRRLFILGKPGAGKTTFLKHLTLQAAQGKLDKIPIFVSLKEWSDAGLELLPFLVRQFEICDFPHAAPFIEQILTKGKALVLFDGLDEVKQEEKKRESTIAAMRDFCKQYFASQCLITCRIAATEYTFEQFTYVELADFTEPQIKTFVSKWFQGDTDKLRLFEQEFAKPENRGLKELANTPLLL